MAATKPENRTALIVGSPRKQSFIRMVAKTLISLAPDSVRLEILRIGQLPIYNQDLDDNPPKEWDDFRSNLNKFDAVIFVTPELNRSGPGVLKNAFSLASQTFERNTVSENACSAISISIGALGGFGASQQLRQTLVFLNVPFMPQAKAYVGEPTKIFSASGNLNNDSSRKFLATCIAEFLAFVEKSKMTPEVHHTNRLRA